MSERWVGGGEMDEVYVSWWGELGVRLKGSMSQFKADTIFTTQR